MTTKIQCSDTTPHVDHYWAGSWCRGKRDRDSTIQVLRERTSGLFDEYMNDIDDAGLLTEAFSQSQDELVEDFGLWLTLRGK